MSQPYLSLLFIYYNTLPTVFIVTLFIIVPFLFLLSSSHLFFYHTVYLLNINIVYHYTDLCFATHTFPR